MRNQGDPRQLSHSVGSFFLCGNQMTASFHSCGTYRSCQIRKMMPWNAARRRELALTPSFKNSAGRLSRHVALELAIRLSASTTSLRVGGSPRAW